MFSSKKNKNALYTLTGREREDVQALMRQSIAASASVEQIIRHIANREAISGQDVSFDLNTLTFIRNPQQTAAAAEPVPMHTRP